MGELLNQLGHLFLESVPTVVFVFLLLVILEKLFFQPVTALLKKRQEATQGALARARELAATAETKAREYEEALQLARQEIYRQREAQRRASLLEHDEALKGARAQSEKLQKEAQVHLAGEIARVKAELEKTCGGLAEEITTTVLGTAESAGTA